MAIVVKFDVEGMDSAKYDQVIRELEESGQGSPNGRLYHVSYGDRNRLQVIDVWENKEKFEAFGQKLMPILGKLGIQAKPEVQETYNIIKG